MATIFLVDDEPMNRELLRAYLEGDDHVLVEAESGNRALELAETIPPDLVLLDVMMPGLSGYETTRRFKEQERGEFLPIVLITALSDPASRRLGAGAGADEFLTKPVDKIELETRIANLLALRNHMAALRASEASLVQRNVDLTELHRFKDEMTALLVHDLKNPLSVVASNVDFVLEELPGAPEVVREALQETKGAGRRISRLLSNLADLSRLESSRLDLHRTIVEVRALLAPIVQQRAVMARSREIHVDLVAAATARAEADSDLLSRVIENLVDNSFRHTPRGGRIEISVHDRGARTEIQVGNSGPPIPLDARAVIFEKYGQASRAHGRMNLGLGLYFCRLAIEKHGGSLRLEERPDLPAIFALDLPSAGAP